MKYKTNFKAVIILHLIGIILLGVLFSFTGVANSGVLKDKQLTLVI